MGLDVKIGEFDVDDLDDINQRWTLYIDKLARYFKHNGVEGDDMKINDFLLAAGDGVVKLYYAMDVSKIKTYDELIEKFTERFNAKQNEFINVFKFNKIAQFEEEPFDKFVGRLKEAAKLAKLSDNDIVHRIVVGCKSRRLRERILSSDKVDLIQVISYGQSGEMVGMQSREIANRRQNEILSGDDEIQPTTNGRSSVNRVQQRRTRQDQNGSERQLKYEKCIYCGRPHVFGKCPARCRVCNKCGGKDHYAVMCETESRKINKVEVEESSDDSMEYGLWKMTST
jgi:hypothetical protein